MTKWKQWRARMAASAKATQQKHLEATINCIGHVMFNLSESKPLSSSSSPQSDAPPGLEKQYRELYSLLRPCLVERQRKSNVTALLMGLRGSGKTLLLEKCLKAFEKETDCGRIVRLNGLVVRGDDVGFAVKEIVRQLSGMAVAETRRKVSVSNKGDDGGDSEEREQKRARRELLDVEKLLRFRNSSFTSNLALLDEALRIACVDSLPILIVLDEMDAFLGSTSSALEGMLTTEGAAFSHRQLLLYHLLDRVATQGSFLSLVGMTSHLAAVGMFEKRIKSRAEGTSKVIYVCPHTSFSDLVKILLTKFHHDAPQDEDHGAELSLESEEAACLKKSISDILVPPSGEEDDEIDIDAGKPVRDIMEQHYKLGKDVRWFSRVLSLALSLYMEDCKVLLRKNYQSMDQTVSTVSPSLEPQHILQALATMGAASLYDEKGAAPLYDVNDPRLETLLDLSGPQLAVLLSARRILSRDGQKEESPSPLTMERISHEYQSYRGSSNRYDHQLIFRAFVDLLEMDVLRPSADHGGGGPLQYDYSQSYYEMDPTTMSRMPLHVPVEMDRELGEALNKGDLLDCSTALREWAKKMN